MEFVEHAGLDRPIIRVKCFAERPGYLEPHYLGLGVRVMEKDRPLMNELKNAAFLTDRNLDLELRVGDFFMIYLSKGGS